MYTYELTEKGFKVLKNGKVVLDQPHYPELGPTYPIKDEDKEDMAKAAVLRRQQISEGVDNA